MPRRVAGQLGDVVPLRLPRWDTAIAPPTPIMARARPPAAPMPASPQSNPLGGVWIRTTACGALPGVATGIISLSGRLNTLEGGWLAVVAAFVALTVAVAVGAPAAASDRMTAAVVVMRWVLIMSTCLLCWSIAACDRCGGDVARGWSGVVETGLDPVDTALAGVPGGATVLVAFAIGAPNEMEFRVLGSLEVVDHDGPVALGAPKQRALLAVLLLHRGEPVSTDRLIDEIWGEQPPASATKLVQGYVSNMRKALGDGQLVTQGRGYLLRIEPGQTDVDRFEALAAEGRRALERGDALTAAAVLREALALWRGPPLSDFAYEPFAQPEIARLEEARLVVLEDRIDADLASGEATRLVGELEALVREHPLRERLRGQLMLALYRSGRQADALDAYRDARRKLLDDLGLDPGSELQELSARFWPRIRRCRHRAGAPLGNRARWRGRDGAAAS